MVLVKPWVFHVFLYARGYPDISELIWIFAQASRYVNSFPSPRWIQTISSFSMGKWWFCLNTGYLINPIKSRVSRVFSLKKIINWVFKITPWPPVQACAGCPPEVLKAGDGADGPFWGSGYGWPCMNPIPLIIEPPGYGPQKSVLYIYIDPILNQGVEGGTWYGGEGTTRI